MTTLASLAVLLADANDGHHGAWGAGWMWGWGMLMMVAFVALIGLAIWGIARSQRRPAEASPHEILAERYARGEIEADEYQEKLTHLR